METRPLTTTNGDDTIDLKTESSSLNSNAMIEGTTIQSLSGESLVFRIQDVVHVIQVPAAGEGLLGTENHVSGTLVVTNYQLVFTSTNRKMRYADLSIPLGAMDEAKIESNTTTTNTTTTTTPSQSSSLRLKTKDWRVVKLNLSNAYQHYASVLVTHNNEPLSARKWLKRIVDAIMCIQSMKRVFAFSFNPPPTTSSFNYDARTEYIRLGLINDVEEHYSSTPFRLLHNADYKICPSYPQYVVVPKTLSHTEILASAAFRSKSRLPVVVWRHSRSGATLSRSSQPRCGVVSNKCEADRKLLFALRKTSSSTFYIADARKPLATRGNRLKGKGTENARDYDNATVLFLGIANIHKMRDSITSLRELLAPNVVAEGDKGYLQALEDTRWLKHVMRVLGAATRVARILHYESVSVLVHCSDGWDRTPQLTSTAQIILDPFYRTIDGLAVLIEKEWVSFGHKFSDRLGVGQDPNVGKSERSPVMLQWLDVLYQISVQFPNAMEFNQEFLIFIASSLTSGLFRNFLYNTEAERRRETAGKTTTTTTCIWSVLADRKRFLNPNYVPTVRPIFPRVTLKKIRVWEALHSRYDLEYCPLYQEFLEQDESNIYDDDDETLIVNVESSEEEEEEDDDDYEKVEIKRLQELLSQSSLRELELQSTIESLQNNNSSTK